MRTILCTAAFLLPLLTASAQSTQPARRRTRPAMSTAPSIPAAAAPACTCQPAVLGINPNYHPQPYSAKQTSTRMQRLADGTAIQQTTVTLLYRNSQGSTRSDNMRSQNGDTTTFIQIYDYPTQTRYTWNVGPGALPTVTVYRPNRRAQQAPMAYTPQRYYPTRTESLPPQSIEGIYVTGERTVRTTPANYEGNDRDIVVTTERWTAPALGLLVRSTMEDPRQGKTTVETTDIQQTEPDPSLFQPPAGYTLREANQ